MFGYVRPASKNLSEAQKAHYQALYCGLCHALGRRYGFIARMTLNYDFTFLVLLLTHAEPAGNPCLTRCPAHPFRRRPACFGGTGLSIAADETILLTWRKLRDTVRDEGVFRGLPARIASLLLRPACRKAAQGRPAFAKTTDECLTELDALERANSPSLDRTADAFARILRAAAPETGDEAADRTLAQLLYHVGRWIYLIDALDDLQEDRTRNRYNPLLARFGGEPDRDWLRTTLKHSRALACSAFELLSFGENRAIAENILYLGIPAVEELVFTGAWKNKKHGRTNHE